MHAATTVAVAVLAAGVTSWFVATAAAPPPSTAPSPDDHLQLEITRLQEELAALRTKVAATPAADAARTSAPEVSQEQIDLAVERFASAHGGSLVPAAVDAAAKGATGGGGKVDVAAAIRDLHGHANYWNNADRYKQLLAAGAMGEFVAGLEALATANPTDATAQMDLGNAYLAWLQLDQTKWQLSMKADASFDKVLALDEDHWEARFTKAMSYTFWPDFLGKKKEAIAHFERLVDLQDRLPVQDYQAQTYLYLGNLLEQRGETERAREMWRRGLARHPQSAELRQRLGQ